ALRLAGRLLVDLQLGLVGGALGDLHGGRGRGRGGQAGVGGDERNRVALGAGGGPLRDGEAELLVGGGRGLAAEAGDGDGAGDRSGHGDGATAGVLGRDVRRDRSGRDERDRRVGLVRGDLRAAAGVRVD